MYAAKGAGRGRAHLAGPVGAIHADRIGRFDDDHGPAGVAAPEPTPQG